VPNGQELATALGTEAGGCNEASFQRNGRRVSRKKEE
jgi:hypothetical protein